MRPVQLHRRSGMTIVELMVSMVISSLLLGSLVSVSKSSGDAYQGSMRPLELETRARRAMGDIVEALSPAHPLSYEETERLRRKFRHLDGETLTRLVHPRSDGAGGGDRARQLLEGDPEFGPGGGWRPGL